MYAQRINGVWTELRGNIVFSPTVYQTAESLTDEQRTDFGVYLIVDMPYHELSPSQKLGKPIYTIAGNTVERTWPAIDKTPDEIAADQQALQNQIVSETQRRLDEFAQTRGYDSILSACTYATSSVPKFRSEGQYCVDARDATWAKLYEILAEVQSGARPAPSGYADIEPDLPVLAWPE